MPATLLVLGLAVLAGPSDALAGTVSASPDTAYGSSPASTKLEYRAASEEANRLSVARLGGTVVVRDEAGMEAGAGCSSVEDGVAVCPVQQSASYWVRLGDGDDIATVEAAGLREGVLGGEEGDDVLTGGSGKDKINGDDGNDELRGGDGQDRLHGDAGDDRLVGGEGFDVHRPEPGNDTVESRDGELDEVLCGGSTSGRNLVDRFDFVLSCIRLERAGHAAAGLSRPHVLDFLAFERGPTVAVVCPQDALRCVGSLRIYVRGRLVGSRGFAMTTGYDWFTTPVTPSLLRVLRRRTVTATVVLTTRDTAGGRRRDRVREDTGRFPRAR